MTSEELDRALDVYEDVADKVTALVTAEIMKAQINLEQEVLVRTQLTENYRFWSKR